MEQITVCGITFRYSNDVPHGLSRVKRLIYIKIAGGTIYDNFGFDYVKALAERFFTISEVVCFKTEDLDMRAADIRHIITEAKGKKQRNIYGNN